MRTGVVTDRRRDGIRNLWAPIAVNFAVGVSLGLPLFLDVREESVESARAA